MTAGPRIRITRVPGQGWGLYDGDEELVGVFETRARARAAASEPVIMASEPAEPSATDDGSWDGWPLGEPDGW